LSVKPFKLFGRLGLSELLYTVSILTVVVGLLYLQFSGVATPPSVEIEAYVEGRNIVIRVVDGDIPRMDWQYIVYNIHGNPPLIWTSSSEALKSGSQIVLASNLPPGVYKIVIMHKPTQRIIFEEKITVPG